MNESNLRYSDERDRSYGIAGMAITLVALDGQDMLREINIDAAPGYALLMANDFGLKGNPRMSAKIVWERAVRELRITASMVLGNIAARRCVVQGQPLSSSDTAPVKEAVRAEGALHCELDSDEADSLFEHCLDYVDRVFSHRSLTPVVHGLADRIEHQRVISSAELTDILAQLGVR